MNIVDRWRTKRLLLKVPYGFYKRVERKCSYNYLFCVVRCVGGGSGSDSLCRTNPSGSTGWLHMFGFEWWIEFLLSFTVFCGLLLIVEA